MLRLFVMWLVGLAMVAMLTACGGGSDKKRPRSVPVAQSSIDTTNPDVWQVGPILEGRNISEGVQRPVLAAEGGWHIVFPSPPARIAYVTFRHGSLLGKSAIRMSFIVEGHATARLVGKGCDFSRPSSVTLYFQRRGDDMTKDGWRWWATFATVPLQEGYFDVVAPLDGAWTSVFTMTKATHPEAFAAAIADADRVGFTFGDCESYGHGAAVVDGEATFRVLEFKVE